MLDHVYSTPKALHRAQRSWLKADIDRFLFHLANQGYARGSLWAYANLLLHFGAFLERQGIRDLVHLPQRIEPFLAKHYPPKARKDIGRGRSILSRFVSHLIREGAVPRPDCRPSTVPCGDRIDQYVAFLEKQRGLCPQYLRSIRRRCAALLTHLYRAEGSDLKSARPEALHRFLIAEAKRCGRAALSQTCSIMRGFLGFLERQGLSASGLASSVLAPCIYKHERCPRFLTPTEVDRVLGVIDRQTVLGKRDYAMLMLLSRYGLRGIEVVRLQLDHLDWRNQRLHVRHRKAGNNTVYPLGVLVGEAIVAYLRQARPTSTCREVFLRSNAPFAPLTCRTLSSHVRKYLAQAGLQAERAGTHTFRYSCAQRLFEVGMSLKTIGDYLGHSDPNTTQRYTKIALDQLREVAVGDGEDLL